MQKELYANYQNTNPEVFNQDLIYIREKEDIDSYFEDLFKTLNAIPGIEYINMTKVSEEFCAEYIKKRAINIEESRLDLIEANFKLTIGEESKEVKLHLFIPKLVDHFFYVLNGNRYFAILQLADKNWYSVRNGIFLKTLLMPLGVRHKTVTIEAKSGTEYTGKVFLLDFFKAKGSNINSFKNFFSYFFVKYGFNVTMEMLGIQDDVAFVQPTDVEEQSDDYEYFSINKNYLIVNKERLITDVSFKNLVTSLHHVLTVNVKKYQSIDNVDFWRRRILNNPTAKIERAEKTIASLERILDERTKKNLREIPEGEKDNSFQVVKYMVQNYEELFAIDGVDVYTRRLRLAEYLIFPLLLKWSEIAIRVLNSRNVDIKRLETVFSNIGAMFLVKRLVTNELLRYSNVTNALNLFNVALRWSARGPQSLGANGADVLMKYRSTHPSFIGNISLNTSSASDPGTSGTLVPFCDNIDRMFFERDLNN